MNEDALNVLCHKPTPYHFQRSGARMCQMSVDVRVDLRGISPRPSHAPRRACLLSDISQTDSQYPLNTPSPPTHPPHGPTRPPRSAALLASISPQPRRNLAAISPRSRRAGRVMRAGRCRSRRCCRPHQPGRGCCLVRVRVRVRVGVRVRVRVSLRARVRGLGLGG